jgi:HAE1 family hydrophobic/amphiphilic exporter-1
MLAARIAVRRPVTTSMFVVAVCLFGLVSLDRLALNLLPDISYPSLTIQTTYEDAAPEEIEALITRPVEESVGVSAGLTRLSSISRPGQSEVVLEFGWVVNMDLASIEVREKLDLITLPEDADKPVILRFDPSYDPIMRVQLYSDMSLSQLRFVAEEEMKKRLESVEGVAAIKVAGGREEQIRVEIDEKKLAELGIPITEVTQVLQQENLNQASGSLYDLDANYLVRMLNEFRTVDEIRGIIIRDSSGRRVLLGDIAGVQRGAKERGVITRYNGDESVELAIYKEGDANTVQVAQSVKTRLGSLKGQQGFPKNLEWAVVFNQADFISESVSNVLNAASLGGLLATLILFIFLRDVRSTLIIALSIPVSILATFALMYQTGITLNIMSLGGVALGVGMLVDNSIVVLEAVDRYRRQGGSIREQVYKGTKEVGAAVTASTLTTVAVFLPLVFVEGIAGQLFRDQALTITYALLASLAVALTFIPMALALEGFATPPPKVEPSNRPTPTSGWGALKAGVTRGIKFLFIDVATVLLADGRRLVRWCGTVANRILDPLLSAFDRFYGRIEAGYPKLLTKALDNPAYVVLTTLATIVLAVGLSATLGGELIPSLSQGEFSFEIELPEGRPLEQTDLLLQQVEDKIKEYPEVDAVFSRVGGSQSNQFAAGAIEENFGQLFVMLKNKSDKASEASVIERIRRELAQRPDVKYVFSRPTLFSFKTPIEVEIYAFDLERQRLAADMIAARLASIDGLGDIQTTTQLGNPEVQIRFDRERLARLGLEENQVSQVLRNKIRGDVASRFREGDRQIDILVRAEERDRTSIADLGNLVINAPPGGANQRTQDQDSGDEPAPATTAQTNRTPQAAFVPIRLSQVAAVQMSRGPSEVRRIRSQRAAVVSASLTGRDLNSVSRDIRVVLADIQGELPPGVTATLGGQNEELETSFSSLMFALGLAVFLVYLVMASQFESLVHPFIILFTVPLALAGVVISLAVTGTSVSVVALLGVIVLAGIVVNNAIVLLDYANQLRREGVSKRDAIVQAGRVRLRPIVMTTLTTVLGLAPMAIGVGEGAELRTPMAVAVMGGLALSTLLTLVLIPVVYEWADRKRYEVADSAESGSTDAALQAGD